MPSRAGIVNLVSIVVVKVRFTVRIRVRVRVRFRVRVRVGTMVRVQLGSKALYRSEDYSSINIWVSGLLYN
jgi:hypothetical protein